MAKGKLRKRVQKMWKQDDLRPENVFFLKTVVN